ncbi:MAG: translation initiation factor IF-2 subunit beta [Nitrososphaerota archaeon]|jgi:translation initiation factor 2 subunit 2|nr:translation initiation factor IF-2 subunit beta [Nitrososphaerota archaeon]MDG7044648.1 translation initiation factor IF-2 subunit beta [Nitrososphaerota archaeon]MDG7047784.1 translation initiation factor IF-2 subunit beta [Nitrososphaerota archaeon]MDG7051872.1 translation initiation factor IF-2 subunit beta [Nitrososphaerota archaeon]
MTEDYLELLNRIKDSLKNEKVNTAPRLAIPEPEVFLTGHRTIIRNFRAIANALNREPGKVLINIAKQLGAPATMGKEGEAIILGKKDFQAIRNTIQYYIKTNVTCPVCGSMDTKLTKERRITFIICEACGSRSPIK